MVYKHKKNDKTVLTDETPNTRNNNMNENRQNDGTARHIPSPSEDTLRFCVFGGVEEIGKNMHALEWKDSIIIFDCGFMFPESDTPGVNYIIPNIQYLLERKEKVRGIVITHGHLDHIGSLPFAIDRLGYPPVFSRRLTIALMKKRQDEHPNLNPVDFREVETNSRIKISDDMTLAFFAVTHTIPDSMGVIVETPHGDVVYTGDLKLDHTDGVADKKEEDAYKIFEKRNTLLTVADSTNAGKAGFSIPEKTVTDTIMELISTAQGRVILGSFASQIDRNIIIIEKAAAVGKKIIIQGKGMIDNLRIATDLGMLNIPKDAFITVNEMDNYPAGRIVIVTTGSQGEEFAGLQRIASGVHRFIKARKEDTIILSSSIIPGNEQRVWTLKDNLSRFGPTIITYETSDVHSSGHANREELRWVHNRIRSKFFIPVHGYHYMLVSHAAILKEAGMPADRIVIPNNGSVIDIKNRGEKMVLREETMPMAFTIVDGTKVGEVQDVVMHDRKILSQNGMVVVNITIDPKKRSVKSPRMTSRGFVYMRESQDLIRKARGMVRYNITQEVQNNTYVNSDAIKRTVTRNLNNLFFRETGKRPLIVPIVFISNV